MSFSLLAHHQLEAAHRQQGLHSRLPDGDPEIPTAESGKFAVIALMTYLISVAGLTYIVAYVLALFGEWAWWRPIVDFIIPTLIGNIIDGAALFAAISYAQVMKEI